MSNPFHERIQSDWLPMPDAYIIAEDGHYLRDGDRCYNYYDMEPGKLQIDEDDIKSLEARECPRRFRKSGLWFWFLPDNGRGRQLLNGERVCSLEFARAKGWPGAN